ncbi:hypothetical protein PIB30_045811 [Stylosanthes scabra]|uniref:Uncharacterized protein n=1 Tax=Stylosanthes scabra TaxID=79078 RepID=A0ABU6RG94_9FABA|nr:hypothetical protein [Stylosanthes scabra]
MADFNSAIAAMQLQNSQRWDVFQQRFDAAQEENRKSFSNIYERLDKMDHQLNFLCNTNQFMNEDLLYPQKEEEMRIERQRYQRIVEEAAAQKAKEKNKGKARGDEEEL